MKKRLHEADDEMLPEYDFSKMKGGVRGKYAERMKGVVRMVVLEGDVADAFPTARDVNEALRSFLRLTRDAAVKATIIRGAAKGPRMTVKRKKIISRNRGTDDVRVLAVKSLGASKAGGGAKKRHRAATR